MPVSLAAYLKAIRLAKQNPDQLFDRGLCSAFPKQGQDIMEDFLDGVMDRINQHMPSRQDNKGWSYRLLRHLKRHGRGCKFCGTTFYPQAIWQQYCSADCGRC